MKVTYARWVSNGDGSHHFEATTDTCVTVNYDGWKITFAFHKIGSSWQIIDLLSGMHLGVYYKTQKEAKEAVQPDRALFHRYYNFYYQLFNSLIEAQNKVYERKQSMTKECHNWCILNNVDYTNWSN